MITSTDPSLRIIGVTKFSTGGEIDIAVNEGPDEVRGQLREPNIYENPDDFPPDELKKGMDTDIRSIGDFDMKEDVPIEDASEEDQAEATTLRWVHRWKGFVKSRLCVRGFTQEIDDLDVTYASTPMIWTLFILLVLALPRGWAIRFCTISTAFLHATLGGERPIFVWPP